MKTGIYKITNTVNGKIYIGQAKNIESRWSNHKSALRRQKHYNSILQNSWNKYGEIYFVFEIIEICDFEELFIRENYWCKLLNSHMREFGYNLGITTDTKKYYLSDEAKKRIGDAQRGIPRTEKEKEKISKSLTGRKLSDKVRTNMSNGQKGKVMKDETKDKIANARRNYLKENPLNTNKKWVKSKNKKVYSMNIFTKEIVKHSSIKEASLINKKARPNIISCCCHNVTFTTGNCVWAFKRNELLTKLNKIPERTMKVIKNRQL